MSSRPDRNEETTRRAHADLKRLSEQSEKLLGAQDTSDMGEPEDSIEIWGKRLGRGIGLVLGAYLIFYFMSRYGLL